MTPDVRTASANAEDLPYRYRADEIDFGVQSFTVDDSDPGDPDYDERAVNLYEYGPWDRATISVSLTIDQRHVGHVFAGEPPYEAKLVVAVDSEATQTRYEEVLDDGPFTGGTATDELTLERELLRGTVTLTPRLVRTSDSDQGLPYAPRRGMRVAGGEPWKVHVDEPGNSGEGFPFVYRDFSEGDYPEDALHILGSNPSDPKVLVNSCHDPIVDILQTDPNAFYSQDLYLKRVIKTEMGTSLWMQLVLHTAATIAESEEPEFDWQEGVVEEISPYLFDDDPDYEVAVERLGRNVSDVGELSSFVRELNEAVQLYVEQADRLNDYIEEFV